MLIMYSLMKNISACTFACACKIKYHHYFIMSSTTNRRNSSKSPTYNYAPELNNVTLPAVHENKDSGEGEIVSLSFFRSTRLKRP